MSSAELSPRGYRLTVANGATTKVFSMADLAAMPQATHRLPIACVEGWSANAEWTGVVLADLLAAAGASPDSDVRMISPEAAGAVLSDHPACQAYPRFADADRVAVNGQVLDLDHGYPCRLIAPSSTGVLQTEWLSRIEVV